MAHNLEQHQAAIVEEFGTYPSLGSLASLDCDIVLIDLDSNREAALDLVEGINAQNGFVTVMVYSRSNDADLLARCMRAGAREFLAEPVLSTSLAEALRASARRMDKSLARKTGGRILVFWGAKGGVGVTTLATNFAIALKKEANRKVALADLNLRLGDAAMLLAMQNQFTILDALQNSERLDREFVSTLLVEHQSGVALLAASDQYVSPGSAESANIGRLLSILREQFPFVVVDGGPSLGEGVETLFDLADCVYLVAQVDVPALRNAQRIVAHLQRSGEDRVQVILNRYEPRKVEVDEERIAKALGLEPRWKVPDDRSSVERCRNSGQPLIFENSPVSRVLEQMARVICGKSAQAEKKKRFGIFG